MTLELFINSIPTRLWLFDNPKRQDFNKSSLQRRESEMDQRITDSLAEVDRELLKAEKVELFIRVKASVQPRDINPDDYKKFIKDLEDKRVNNVVGKYQPRLKNGELT